jgi:tetratricopeptide (TPR) repeat protein
MPLRSLLRFLAVVVTPIALVGFLTAQTDQTQSAPEKAASSQTSSKDDPDRQHALELLNEGKQAQAMPLFEQLCARYPKDSGLWEGWGVSALGYSQTLTDPDLRKKARARARSFLLKAKELGDNSNLLQVLLGMIPEDGSESAYSPSNEVNGIMQKAEADFSRGDYDKAREGYLQALLLEPKNYDAALFIGDVYFKQHINGSAGEWFARAIEIDPNRETAYRYWGDALWAMGKNAEAREKYIQAVIAEPYNNNRSWMGLTQWAQRTKVTLNWVRLQDKGKIIPTTAGLKLTLDPSFHTEDPMFKPWMVYYGRRLQWPQGKFKQQFPSESQYRRTLSEEVDALRLMVLALKQPNITAIDPSLAALIKVDQAGFVEPFALLNRADKEIALDYAPYRTAHRDMLYRYFDEFVVPKAPPQ